MREFTAADAPCFALGVVEERNQQCGFLGLRPDRVIPAHIADTGFAFGHTLLGNDHFEVVQFVFHFYGFATYNTLLNPNNPFVRAILTMMVESGDYLFFALNSDGSGTAFRSEIERDNLAVLKANFSRMQRSDTTDAQYRKAVSLFKKHPDPAGVFLHWVCRDNVEYLDIAKDRLKLTPA